MIIDTIKYGCTLCGIKYLGYKFLDKLCGTNNTEELIYRCAKKANPADYEKLIKLEYKSKTGKELNLDNPQTFNEKIQWMKIHDATPLKTRLADKYLVREWVSDKIGDKHLIPLLGVWISFDEIDFDELPEQFVLKANHGSGWNAIVQDKSAIDFSVLRQQFEKWMNTDFAFVGGYEIQYSSIKPRIIAEKLMSTSDGKGLVDYKFHCFNGIPQIIEVIGDRNPETHSGKEITMTPEWKPHPGISLITYDKYEFIPPKPENYDDMISIACKLSDSFKYVRVDLYNIDGSIYFGEMTFSPASGCDPTDDFFTYADLIELGI